MSRKRFNNQKVITPAHQLFNLRRLFLEGEGHISRNRLNWSYCVRPTPLGRCYQIHISYQPARRPKIFILYPSLNELAEERKIPHVYSQKNAELCLYRPGYREWTPDKLIAETIVPWTFVWLFYFEEWLYSDEWKGGGDYPPARD